VGYLPAASLLPAMPSSLLVAYHACQLCDSDIRSLMSTYLLMFSSNCTIFSSSSTFLGFGLRMVGFSSPSSRLNQSENSDRDAKSLSNWSCIARAAFNKSVFGRCAI
jgi:hypothetical protein